MQFRQASIASIAFAAAAVASSVVVVSAPADAAVSWRNCAAVHRTYPHGVGKRHAHDIDHDHTGEPPVTNFKRSNHLYAVAMNHNRGLDRDRDGIACESH